MSSGQGAKRSPELAPCRIALAEMRVWGTSPNVRCRVWSPECIPVGVGIHTHEMLPPAVPDVQRSIRKVWKEESDMLRLLFSVKVLLSEISRGQSMMYL